MISYVVFHRLCSVALTNRGRCPSVLFCKMVYTLNPGILRRKRVPGSTLVAQARLESVFRQSLLMVISCDEQDPLPEGWSVSAFCIAIPVKLQPIPAHSRVNTLLLQEPKEHRQHPSSSHGRRFVQSGGLCWLRSQVLQSLHQRRTANDAI